MCGIYGWALTDKAPYSKTQKEIMMRLGAMGADKRGGQSYGTLHLDSKGGAVVRKGMGPLVGADFDELSGTLTGFGHSRLATHGEVNMKNCHPFKIGSIVGAHNGVLSNAHELDNLFGPKEVDSEHIFARIDENDNLSSIRGYGIIEWYDLEDPNKIFLCNIGNGDLTLFELGGKNAGYGYFWTSEQEDGNLALASAGIKDYEAYDLVEGAVYYFVQNDPELWVVEGMELKVQPNVYRGFAQMGTYTGKDTSEPITDLSIWNQNEEEELGEDWSEEDLVAFFDKQMKRNEDRAENNPQFNPNDLDLELNKEMESD